MAYHFTTTVKLPFDAAVAETMEALKRHGFGVLTTIDVEETLRRKLGVDFRPYRILGACNPEMAYRALQCEDKIGTMLPCNVVLQQRANGMVEISAIDPGASMQAVGNAALGAIAEEVRAMLQQVIADVAHSGPTAHRIGT